MGGMHWAVHGQTAVGAPSEVERHCLDAVEEIKRISEPPKRGRRK